MSFRHALRILLTLCALVGPLAARTQLHAALLYGDYLGTFSGDDSESSLFDELELDVLRLSQIDSKTTNNGLISYAPTEVVYTGSGVEYFAGYWFYAESTPVDYLVVKAGPDYAVYDYTGGYDSDWPNAGQWNTDDLDDAAMIHLTLYSRLRAIPEPTGLLLAFSAVGLLAIFRRRRRSKLLGESNSSPRPPSPETKGDLPLIY